jgi:hypothetical protein
MIERKTSKKNFSPADMIFMLEENLSVIPIEQLSGRSRIFDGKVFYHYRH